MLSLAELDALRSQFPYGEAAARLVIDCALQNADRAVALDARNLREMQAQVMALFYDRQFARMKEIGERALAPNPNDTDFLGEHGSRLATSGDWDAGCAMILKTRERWPLPTACQDTGLALCAYFAGDIAKGMSMIGTLSPKSHPLTLLVALAICIEAQSQTCVTQVRAEDWGSTGANR